jgi:hypothetical protein
MADRIINLNIDGAYMTGGVSLGASGSANSVVLRMTFDSAWDNASKTVYFLDANGENAVGITLGLDKLVSGETSVYDVPVPAEAMSVPGNATVTVKGAVVSGSTTLRQITTKSAQFRILKSDIPDSAGTPEKIPSGDKDQLQSEIDKLNTLFTLSVSACKTSETAAASSAAAADSSAKDAASTVAGFDSHASAKQSEVDASAKAAADSAAAAKNSENASASSSGAAKASETAADTSAKTAAAKAAEAESASAEAKTSEGNAKTSETNASLSASAAASMASGASKSAEQAAASAGTASAAALEASNNASSALSSKEAAASSETNASSSAAAAKASADKAAEIVGGDFATKSELSAVSASAANDASTKASSALTSANSYTDTKVDGIDLSPYAKTIDLSSHIGDKTKHITAEERTAWNGKAPESHKHITQAATHKSGGTDPILPADIGAATKQDIADALEEFSTCPFSAGTAAPANTNLLWIDTGNGSIMKYYDSTSKTWKSINFVWGA